MCQYSAYVVLENVMRNQHRQQQHQHQQGGALEQSNNNRNMNGGGQGQPNQQGRGPATQGILQPNGDNIPRRSHGHKMTRGRRSNGQNKPKQSRCDSSSVGSRSGTRCRSGNKSAGSSPTKQFYYGLMASADGDNRTRSRSYTPPSTEGATAAAGRARSRRKRSPSGSPISSPAYAGARFSEPPSPNVLPKPPTHWFAAVEQPAGRHQAPNSCVEMTNALKGMLKVHC